jgi:hypothetical protein
VGLIKFKQIKPLPFDFKPRYWDPVKEAREQRKKEIEALQENSIEGMKARISHRLKRGGYNEYYSEKKRLVQKQNFMLLAALIAVLLGGYLFLLKYMPIIERWLDKSLTK